MHDHSTVLAIDLSSFSIGAIHSGFPVSFRSRIAFLVIGFRHEEGDQAKLELASVYNSHHVRHCLTCNPDQIMTARQNVKLAIVSLAPRIRTLRTNVEAPKRGVSTPPLTIPTHQQSD
jgi:hypothetical protein